LILPRREYLVFNSTIFVGKEPDVEDTPSEISLLLISDFGKPT